MKLRGSNARTTIFQFHIGGTLPNIDLGICIFIFFLLGVIVSKIRLHIVLLWWRFYKFLNHVASQQFEYWYVVLQFMVSFVFDLGRIFRFVVIRFGFMSYCQYLFTCWATRFWYPVTYSWCCCIPKQDWPSCSHFIQVGNGYYSCWISRIRVGRVGKYDLQE